MPKRKNLVKSNDSNKSKKKVYNYQKKNFAILKLKKKQSLRVQVQEKLIILKKI